MSTKTCPSCHTEIPEQAYRCKQCFHDFDTVKPSSAAPFMVLLKLAAAMAVVASIVFWQTAGNPSEVYVNVDERTQSITGTQMSAAGLQTQQIAFSEISQLEHRTMPNGDHVVIVKTHGGEELPFPVMSYSQEAFATEVATTINNQGFSVPVVNTGTDGGVELLTQ